jgi:prophage DNA circulation protein
MKQSDLSEAAAALRGILDLVLAAPIDRASSVAGSLNQAARSLRTYAESAITGRTFGTQLAAVFTLLRQAGGSFAAVDAIRVSGLGVAVVGNAAAAVVDTGVMLALACQCRIVADTAFVSRQQVDRVRDALDAGFDASIDKASNDFDQVIVRALVAMRAAVMRDLSVRAQPLPKMVSYVYPQRRPALWIAQRLYGDGGRFSEIIAENTVIHPLFMPAAGRALSG